MIDTESGETAPLKPTTVQKTRGLTALVVACAALSFFADEYAVVGGELFLYVLARNVDDYFEKYDDEVQDFLKKSGYKGLLLKPRKNNQDNCPAVIYEPNAFDPSTPPPVLA